MCSHNTMILYSTYTFSINLYIHFPEMNTYLVATEYHPHLDHHQKKLERFTCDEYSTLVRHISISVMSVQRSIASCYNVDFGRLNTQDLPLGWNDTYRRHPSPVFRWGGDVLQIFLEPNDKSTHHSGDTRPYMCPDLESNQM